jgi:dTDP-4-dehydrorhamnose reductase
MKVLVTGAEGQLGYDVVKRFGDMDGVECIGARVGFDITDEVATTDYITKIRPDVLVHCAAYTAVDAAERERKKCYKVNVDGTLFVARACKQIGAKMIFISTDYVFDGAGSRARQTDDVPKPINYYGETKYLGELAAQKCLDKLFIVRTSWVFGINGKNFISTMLSIARAKDNVSVVSDQIGSPTYTRDLAELICAMSLSEKYGVYHATNEGYCSWYDLAAFVFKKTRTKIKLTPILSASYKTEAKRPLNSRLSKNSLKKNGFRPLPGWRTAVSEYLEEIKKL